jgi:hypothetical protein
MRKWTTGDTSRRRYAAPLAVSASPVGRGRLRKWSEGKRPATRVVLEVKRRRSRHARQAVALSGHPEASATAAASGWISASADAPRD